MKKDHDNQPRDSKHEGNQRAIDGLLRELARGGEGVDELFVARVMTNLDKGGTSEPDVGASTSGALRSSKISRRHERAKAKGLLRWIVPAAAAAVLVVVLAFVFFAGYSGVPDVAEEYQPDTPDEAVSPGPVKKHRVVEKDTATAPVPPKKLVEESPAPAEKKGPKLAWEPAPPVEKESPAPEQPKKGPVVAKQPEEPEKPVTPANPGTEPEQAPAPVFLAITIDDDLKSKGKLQVRKGKRWQTVEAEDGTFLWQADEQIRATRLARFTTADGTRVLLSKATLVLGGVEPVTLGLERGEIFCEVAPAEKDEKGETLKTESEGKTIFLVRTKGAEVRATATHFGVKYASGRTTVMVTEGKVILANTKGEVTVPAGTRSSAVKSSAPKKPKRVKAGKYFGWRYQLASPVVWRHDFDKIDGKKEKIRGKLVVLNEPGGKVSAIESGFLSEEDVTPAWNPEVHIVFYARLKEDGGPGYYFVIPENCEIRLRVKSEKPGRLQVSIRQRPDKRGSSEEVFTATDLPVETEWKEIVLHGKDFKPEKNIGSSFQAGLYITWVGLYAFSTGKTYVDWIVVRDRNRK